MPLTHDEVSPAITRLIEDTVREAMAPFAIASVRVLAGRDHDGDPVIYVDAFHNLSGTPIDPAALTELGLSLSEKLYAAGEARYPLIRHHFNDSQDVKLSKHRRQRAGA